MSAAVRWRATSLISRCCFRRRLATIPLAAPVRQDLAHSQSLKRDFKGTRIAWSGDFGGADAELGVLDLCKAALKTLEALGARSRCRPTIRSSVSDLARCVPGRPALTPHPTPIRRRALMSRRQSRSVRSLGVRGVRDARSRPYRLVSGGTGAYQKYDYHPARRPGVFARRVASIGQTDRRQDDDSYHRWMR